MALRGNRLVCVQNIKISWYINIANNKIFKIMSLSFVYEQGLSHEWENILLDIFQILNQQEKEPAKEP